MAVELRWRFVVKRRNDWEDQEGGWGLGEISHFPHHDCDIDKDVIFWLGMTALAAVKNRENAFFVRFYGVGF